MRKKFRSNVLIHPLEKYPFFKKLPRGPALFFHIPKTGGTSIQQALGLPLPQRDIFIKKHYKASVICSQIDPAVWNEAYLFCFVRNPWDRLFSHYRYRKKEGKIILPEHIQSFATWVLDVLNAEAKEGNLCSQLDWIRVNDQEPALDFIGRFEHLHEDFSLLCQQLGIQADLPHLLKSNPPLFYQDHYDDASRERVADFYKEDISFFNYQF